MLDKSYAHIPPTKVGTNTQTIPGLPQLDLTTQGEEQKLKEAPQVTWGKLTDDSAQRWGIYSTKTPLDVHFTPSF
jgi:hypothetical protein